MTQWPPDLKKKKNERQLKLPVISQQQQWSFMWQLYNSFLAVLCEQSLSYIEVGPNLRTKQIHVNYYTKIERKLKETDFFLYINYVWINFGDLFCTYIW